MMLDQPNYMFCDVIYYSVVSHNIKPKSEIKV